MTIKLTSMRADTAAANEGEWEEPAALPGVRLKVRSFGYVPYRIARDQLLAKFSRKYKRETSEERDAEQARAFGQLYAEYILLGWEGFDVPWSEETARTELMRADAAVLRAAVEDCASRVGLPDIEFIEDAAKNSGAPSAGA